MPDGWCMTTMVWKYLISEKNKGMSVAEVLKKDPGYYSWILNSDFTLNTKAVLTKIRLREMSNLITK